MLLGKYCKNTLLTEKALHVGVFNCTKITLLRHLTKYFSGVYKAQSRRTHSPRAPENKI